MNIKRLWIVLIGAILLASYYLRVDNLYTWPRKGATFDEYAWTWQGINLIKQGVPISWSPHPQYKEKELVIYQKTAFYVVKPYLEHPPVFGLIAGSYAMLNGANDMYEVNIEKIRGLALLLGVLSVFILFVLLAELYGKKTALLGAMLYATVPTVVIGSRLVQNENFFIPFWLLSLYMIVKFLKTKRSIYRNMTAIICGLLILAKVPWAAGGLSIILILLSEKKFNDLYKFLLIFIPIGLLYFLYGFYYDKDLFVSLLGLQLNRYDLSFSSVFALFQKPYLTDRFYTDGWIYFGWLSLLILFLKEKRRHIVIISAVISYFLVFLSAIPDEAGHGWYRYPFYPFLIASTAIFLKDYFVKNFLVTFFFVVFVGTSLLQSTWASAFGFSYPLFRIVIITWLFILLPYFYENSKNKRIGQGMSYLWFIILILMNVWAVLLYTEQ